MSSKNLLFQKTMNPFSSYFQASKLSAQTHSPKKRNWEWYEFSEKSAPVNFCLDTSLHGLKFLAKPRRHICERLFWFLAFIASTIILVGLIWNIVEEYKDIPIVTVLNPTEKTMDLIPFPSVTVCNVNVIRKSEVERHLSNAKESVHDHALGFIDKIELYKALAKLSDINHICESTLPYTHHFSRNRSGNIGFSSETLNRFSDGGKYAKYVDPLTTLRNSSQSCDEMIMFCTWLGREQDCDDLFTGVFTEFGYCCSFNSMPMSVLGRNRKNTFSKPKDHQDWFDARLNQDNLIFSEETKKRKYPRRQLYAGRRGGLSFILNPDLSEYYCPNTNSEGFLMGIRLPVDVPQMNDIGLAIKTNSEVFVSVQPDVGVADESIQKFPVKTRKCYQGEEYHLRFYTVYTVGNCQKECITNMTQQRCNCSLYYMPQTSGIPLCKPKRYKCTEEATQWILEHGLSEACEDCLPTCSEISYQKQATHLKLQKNQLQDLLKNSPEKLETAKNASIVHVFFNTDSVYPRLRKETMSLIQLIANAGGLLGVCLGCSILSLLEICYFGTLRIFCNWYRLKSNNRNFSKTKRVIVRKFENSREFMP